MLLKMNFLIYSSLLEGNYFQVQGVISTFSILFKLDSHAYLNLLHVQADFGSTPSTIQLLISVIDNNYRYYCLLLSQWFAFSIKKLSTVKYIYVYCVAAVYSVKIFKKTENRYYDNSIGKRKIVRRWRCVSIIMLNDIILE